MDINDKDDRQEVFQFLAVLRDTGKVNMMGAGPYLEDQFDMTRREARDWVLAWMKH